MTELERAQELAQRGGRPPINEHPIHPTMIQHVQVINAVRAGDHPMPKVLIPATSDITFAPAFDRP